MSSEDSESDSSGKQERSDESSNTKSEKFANFQKWDPLGIDWTKPSASLVVASRNSGKTYLISSLYKEYWKMYNDTVVVFSNTLCNGHWEQTLGAKHAKTMFKGYSEAALLKIFEIAYKAKQEKKKWRCLVILDDVLSSKLRFSDAIRRCFVEGRHYGISVCLITQSLTLIDCSVRDNLSLLFVLNLRAQRQKKLLIENYFSDELDEDKVPKSYKHNEKAYLFAALKHFTHNYGVFIIDYESRALQSIYHWRA